MYIILSKELQKILLTAFSDSLEITLDVVINIMSLNATEYILFYFKNLQYDYEVTYWGFYLREIKIEPFHSSHISHLSDSEFFPSKIFSSLENHLKLIFRYLNISEFVVHLVPTTSEFAIIKFNFSWEHRDPLVLDFTTRDLRHAGS